MRSFLFWVVVLLFAALPAAAQTGGIEVILVNAEDGGVVPGATVVVGNDHGLVAESAELTDEKGAVLFPVLRAGSGYRIEVSFPGFGRQRRTDLRVEAGTTQRVLVQMTGEIRERVQVEARTDLVDLDRTGNSSRFSDDFLEGMPVPGRFYQNALKLAPGVNDADDDGNPNVHGARSRDFKTLVNGISNVDPLTGQWLSYVNPESIEEIEIVSSAAPIEFGRAQGGYARIVQKQGGNDFEGVFNFLWSSSDLDGDGAASRIGDVPDFEWVQPSIQLSGPIVKDRLWYRLSHEYIDRDEPINVISGIEVSTRQQTINDDQITWQVSPRNKLAFQYRKDPLRIENFDLNSAVSAESSRDLETGGPFYGLTWTAPVSPRLIIESQVAYQNNRNDILPATTGIANDCGVFTRYPVLNTARCLNTTVGRTSGSFPETSRDRRQRLTTRAEATWYLGRWLGATHRLKFGLSIENERYFRELDRGPDTRFSFFRSPFGQVAFGTAVTSISVPRTSSGTAKGNSVGFYFEDQFKPLDNLSVTVGARIDREEIDSVGREAFDPAVEAAAYLEVFNRDCINAGQFQGICASNLAVRTFTAFENIGAFQAQLAGVLGVPTSELPLGSGVAQSAFWANERRLETVNLVNNNVSPRVTVAWDPWRDGKTKFAVSAGRFYDKIFLAVPLIEIEPAQTIFQTTGFSLPGSYTPVYFTGLLDTSQITASVSVVDRNLTTPFQDELTASVERAVGAEATVKVTYIQRSFQDQLQDADINHVGNGIALNPGWGEILLLSNINETDYTAYVLELNRRQYRGWELQSSYTWSEAIGDAEDFTLLLGNNRNLADSERGFLSFDQRHIVRLNAMTITPWGIRLGGALRWESGLPYSVLQSGVVRFMNPPEYLNIGVGGSQFFFDYPTGERNDRRNEAFWNIDVRAVREFSMADAGLLQVTLEVFNLLNDDTLVQTDRIDGVFAGVRRFGRQFQVGLRWAF